MLSVVVRAQPSCIAPEAPRLLRVSSACLAQQQHFSVETCNTLAIVLKNGLKIEFNPPGTAAVRRTAGTQCPVTMGFVRPRNQGRQGWSSPAVATAGSALGERSR
jgi:hypothetical protein